VSTPESSGRRRPSRQRLNREAQLLEAATEIFSRKGYAAASIQEIADEIGMLKGSLYHYIGSKEELLHVIFDQAHKEAEQLMDLVTSMDATPTEKLSYYVEHLVLLSLANIDRTSLYFRDWRHLTGDKLDALVRQRRQYESFARRLIMDVYAEAGSAPVVEPKYVSFFVLGGINWLADWYRPGGRDSASAVAKGFARLVLATVSGASDVPMVLPLKP
jgi:AcrR family transcriptional regulator